MPASAGETLDTPVVNTHQATAWNGYEGRHWAEHHERYDAVNGRMNEPLLGAAAITASDRVLDIGCGTGQTTRLAARQAPRGRAVGVDLSGPMLARARATASAEGVANASFEQGDAQVYPFAAGGFDVAISRCAIMFFADPVAAFGNIGRALRPGGRLAVLCPQNMGRDDDFARALAPLWTLMRRSAPAGDTAAESSPGPTSLSDPDRIRDVLTGAGFTQPAITPVTVPMMFGRDPEAAAEFALGMGPMRFNLKGADADAVERARAATVTALRGFQQAEEGAGAGAGEIALHTRLWLVRAARPTAA